MKKILGYISAALSLLFPLITVSFLFIANEIDKYYVPNLHNATFVGKYSLFLYTLFFIFFLLVIYLLKIKYNQLLILCFSFFASLSLFLFVFFFRMTFDYSKVFVINNQRFEVPWRYDPYGSKNSFEIEIHSDFTSKYIDYPNSHDRGRLIRVSVESLDDARDPSLFKVDSEELVKPYSLPIEEFCNNNVSKPMYGYFFKSDNYIIFINSDDYNYNRDCLDISNFKDRIITLIKSFNK